MAATKRNAMLIAEAVDGLHAQIAKERARLSRYESGAARIVIKDIVGPEIDLTDKWIADLRHSIALNEALMSRLTD